MINARFLAHWASRSEKLLAQKKYLIINVRTIRWFFLKLCSTDQLPCQSPRMLFTFFLYLFYKQNIYKIYLLTDIHQHVKGYQSVHITHFLMYSVVGRCRILFVRRNLHF